MSPDSLELLEPKDRAEWRAWLVEHHATSPGVRLAIGKKGNTVTALTYEDAVEEALCFGWIDSMARRLDEHRYTGAMTPRRPGSVWAKSNKERVARLSAAGLMMPAGQAVVDRARADGSWNILTDADDLIEPDDLSHELRAHPGPEPVSTPLPSPPGVWLFSGSRARSGRRHAHAASPSRLARPPKAARRARRLGLTRPAARSRAARRPHCASTRSRPPCPGSRPAAPSSPS